MTVQRAFLNPLHNISSLIHQFFFKNYQFNKANSKSCSDKIMFKQFILGIFV